MVDMIISVIQFVSGLLHLSPELLAAVAMVGLALSEALALIPALKSNSILQLVVNVLKRLSGK